MQHLHPLQRDNRVHKNFDWALANECSQNIPTSRPTNAPWEREVRGTEDDYWFREHLVPAYR